MKGFLAIVLFFSFAWGNLTAQEYKPKYFGTVFKTIVNDSKVNLRTLPALNGLVLNQVSKGDTVTIREISTSKSKIGDCSAYWFELGSINGKSFDLTEQQWVFGQFLDNISELSPTIILFDHFVPATKQRGSSLFVKVRGKSERTVEVYPAQYSGRDYYTFTWSTDDESYFYYDVPGTYLWYPKNNEIKHVTYLGNSGESAWVFFTDDFKYFIQDFGTSPGVRGMVLMETETSRKVFGGGHLDDPEISGHLVTFSIRYDDLKGGKSKLPKSLLTFAIEKMKTTPRLEKNGSLGIQLVVNYVVNADTGELTPKDCKYIYEQ